MLIDAHCHIANLAGEYCISDLIKDAKQQGVDGFISIALTTQEVLWHRDNSFNAVKWGAGIHPNYPACDLSLQDVRDLATDQRISLIGEIGLDRSNPDLKWQLEMFEQQIQIAESYRLPIVVHLVGHLAYAIERLKVASVPVLIHGYAGSIEGYNSLISLGCYFSISNRLLRPEKHVLLQKMISDGRYMFESDAALQSNVLKETNPLSEVLALLNGISSDTSREVLIATQKVNIQRFIGTFDGSI